MIKVKTIEDVVNYQLCTGCGMCAGAEPLRYEMYDSEDYGRRPMLKTNARQTNGQAFASCPGHALEHHYQPEAENYIEELSECWGPVLGVWEGFASDDDTRFNGSSGGAATALANFALSEKRADYVIHTSRDKNTPYCNTVTKSHNKNELLESSGSRYSPASPCEAISDIHQDEKVVFIGKPCDVAALDKYQQINPEINKNIALKIGFFCAGTPSTAGNKALLKRQGVDPETQLTELKFRGKGWPGMWRADYKDVQGVDNNVELTYAESWGFLQSFRQWRCYICPDHTGEFADIAVGDPWYRKVQDGEPGKSLIVARTKRGLDFLLEAQKANAIILETKDSSLLPRSQPNLIKARGDMWPRLAVLRLFGVPIPKFKDFVFFKFWIQTSSIKNMLGSIYGTAVRIKRKALKQNQKLIQD